MLLARTLSFVAAATIASAVCVQAAESPAVLVYSDDPETLPGDGIILRTPPLLTRDRPVRLYAYHASGTTASRRVFLVLRAQAESRVRLVGASAGPFGEDYLYAGHVANVDYLEARARDDGTVVALGPGAPAIVPLGASALAQNDSVVAIYDLSVVDGGPVSLETVTTSGDTPPAPGSLPVNLLPPDGHERRGAYDLGVVAPIILVWSALDAQPDEIPVGAGTTFFGTPIARRLEGPAPVLRGEYGVVRPFVFNLVNPSAEPRRAYLYAIPPAGNYSDATFWFAGDPAPWPLPCFGPAPVPYAIRSFDLAPESSRTVTGDFMTDGGASLPLRLGVTATPPQAPPGPDHCAPAPPPVPGQT